MNLSYNVNAIRDNAQYEILNPGDCIKDKCWRCISDARIDFGIIRCENCSVCSAEAFYSIEHIKLGRSVKEIIDSKRNNE